MKMDVTPTANASTLTQISEFEELNESGSIQKGKEVPAELTNLMSLPDIVISPELIKTLVFNCILTWKSDSKEAFELVIGISFLNL
jgi:hypothetical protein